MNVISYKDKDGVTDRIINPIWITNVKGVKSEYNKDWCIVIEVNRGTGEGNKTFTRSFTDADEYADALTEITSAIASIGTASTPSTTTETDTTGE